MAINQAEILAAGRSLVPDFLTQQLQQEMGRAQFQQANTQNILAQHRIAQDLLATREQEEYSRAVEAALATGDQREVLNLLARFPGQKDALKSYYDNLDALEQRSQLRQSAGIWSALNAGNTDAAIKQVEQRITSDRQAGRDTADDEQQLALLKSGDPKAINSVKGRLGLFMASVVPEKFASVVEQLGTGAESGRKGQVVGRAVGHYDDAGNFVVDYRDPDAGFTLREGETRFGPGAGVAQAGGGSLSVQTVTPAIVEQESGGDYTARNSSTGALGAYQVMPATGSALAQRIGLPWKPELMTSGSDAGRAYQDRIGQAAVQEAIDNSDGDPATMAAYYHGGSDRSKWGPRTQQYANEVVARLGGGQTGGAVAVASVPKAPPASAQRMTPQEVAAEGLDPNVVYYRGANGIPTPVQGQPKQGAAEKEGAYSQSALDAFDRAISTATRLKSHPGLSTAVGMKGLSGGFLGGWVVPGTDAADFNAELDAMKAQVFLPMVQSMKGMGALSNAEGEKLTAAIGALSTKQSEKQFGASLDRIIADLKTYKQRGMPGGGAPVRVRSIQEANALKPGTLYIAPDGKTRRR